MVKYRMKSEVKILNFLNFLLADTEAGGNTNGCGTSQIIMIVIIAVLFAAIVILPLFTNRKRQKEANEMLDTLAVGDEIMTAGGVMGTIVELSTHESGEKLMVIETGTGMDKTRMTFTVQALRINYTKVKLRQEQLARQKEQQAAAKGKNKNAHADEQLPEEPIAEETFEEKPENVQEPDESKTENNDENK